MMKTKKRRVTRKFNKVRFVGYTSTILLVLGVMTTFMCLGSDIAAKYIADVEAVQGNSPIIIEETDYGYSITKTEDGDFRLLQLTDIHIGGGLLSITNDRMAIAAVSALVANAKPDFIIVTGDIAYPVPVQSGTINNKIAAKTFVSLMDALGVPWALTFGNHDTESYSLYTREQMTEFYAEVELCLMSRKNEHIFGYGNQVITLHNRDGAINTALVLMDSNQYRKSIKLNEYDNIHDDQIDWYEQILLDISAGGPLVPSMLFFHIPLEEFRDAVRMYEEGSPEVDLVQGVRAEDVCCSDYENDFFERIVALGSTKAIFCGHDHYNNFDLEYQGVRLVYGLSIDYLAYAWSGIIRKTQQRGVTVIDIADDASFVISQQRLVDIEKAD